MHDQNMKFLKKLAERSGRKRKGHSQAMPSTTGKDYRLMAKHEAHAASGRFLSSVVLLLGLFLFRFINAL